MWNTRHSDILQVIILGQRYKWAGRYTFKNYNVYIDYNYNQCTHEEISLPLSIKQLLLFG